MATLSDIRNSFKQLDPERTILTELVGTVVGIREKEGISQSELSRRSGVPQKTISLMTNSHTKPSLETLAKLIDALDYDLEIKVTKKKKRKV